ncbi:lysozyme [Azospirillum sp. Sh1]|uniref:lysozyme n=1 Tax=Azospirillum sp. Sh1 TaxID=2607285 RepID=UPI0011ECEFBD|nr:lysozyme [Azospirillum sp. Sh1]KAA0571126.1 lysozyme [Azospirillum sp. Sh1]
MKAKVTGGTAAPLSAAVLAMVKHFESLHDGDRSTDELEPMLCPAGVWTVGYGLTLTDPKSGAQLRGKGNRAAAMAEYRRRWPGGLTRAEAERLLSIELENRMRRVDALVTVPLEAYQREALGSFEYNTGGLAGSTLLKKLNAGDTEGAAAAFDQWVKATVDGRKVTMPGLVTRRNAEETMFRGGDWRTALQVQPMPQAVEPPKEMKPLAKSVSVQAGTGGLTLAGVTVAAQQARDASGAVREFLDTLPAVSVSAGWLVAGVLAVAVAVMLYRRFDDHRKAAA